MTSRCRFSTSSYFRTFLRVSKFCVSTCDCADAIARVTILFSIGTSSGTFAMDITRSTICALNSRIRSSPSDR